LAQSVAFRATKKNVVQGRFKRVFYSRFKKSGHNFSPQEQTAYFFVFSLYNRFDIMSNKNALNFKKLKKFEIASFVWRWGNNKINSEPFFTQNRDMQCTPLSLQQSTLHIHTIREKRYKDKKIYRG
jgi:hypothetical protein